MEFVVTTDLAKLQPQEIESNFAETKAWLQNALAPFSAMVVSEDAIRNAKDDRATINRLKKTLDEKRKSVKRQWVQPYIEWEAKVNELISMCDEASTNIDTQVKAFENAAKEQKKSELKAFFDEIASAADVDFYVTFDQIFNPKWLNSSVKIDTAKDEIDNIIQETVDDIKVIADLESDFAEELYLDYKNNHDLKRVLARNKALSEMKASSMARQKPIEPRNEPGGIYSRPESETLPEQPVEAQNEPIKLYDLLLQLRLTEQQARRLKKYLAIEEIETVQSKMKEYKTK